MNLFKSDWVDTIFEGRNQEYGAYVLRKENGRVMLLALLIGAAIFSLAISGPVIAKMIANSKDEAPTDTTIDTKVVMMDIIEPAKPIEPPIEKPIVQKETKTIQEVVKHVPPVIVDKETVQQEVTTVDELKDKIAGSKNVEADLDAGEVVIEGAHSTITNDAEVVENPNQIYEAVEVSPSYPGGLNAFRTFVGRNYSLNVDRDLKGKVLVQFVVEKDGSLTDIKVIRDIGHGSGAEAVRVLKRAQKWNPGIQNGRAVRVRYTLPIDINISSR